jgi:hypothetical protein
MQKHTGTSLVENFSFFKNFELVCEQFDQERRFQKFPWAFGGDPSVLTQNIFGFFQY